MSALAAVACPHCKLPKIGEIANGVSRFQCRRCKRRVMVGRDAKGAIRYLSVDKPLHLVEQSSQIA